MRDRIKNMERIICRRLLAVGLLLAMVMSVSTLIAGEWQRDKRVLLTNFNIQNDLKRANRNLLSELPDNRAATPLEVPDC